MSFQLHPKHLPLGPFAFQVKFINPLNAADELALHVKGVIRDNLLGFAHLALKADRPDQLVLELPPLHVPAGPDDAPCERRFKVQNLSADSLSVHCKCELAPEFKATLDLRLLEHASAAEVHECLLRPDERVDLRVRLASSPHVPGPVLEVRPSGQTVSLGRICLSSPSLARESSIELRCTLLASSAPDIRLPLQSPRPLESRGAHIFHPPQPLRMPDIDVDSMGPESKIVLPF